MAIDFPNSPTVGQQHTVGLQTWEWDGTTWNIVPAVVGGTGEASIFVGNTAPPGPDDGDLWWDTDEPSLLNSLIDPTALVADSTFQTQLAASSVYNAVLNARYAALDNAAWTPYTPVIGGTGWALGNGVVIGRHKLLGAKTCMARGKVTFGSTSTFGANQLTMTLPFAAETTILSLGQVWVAPPGVFHGVCATVGGTSLAFYSVTSAVGALGSMVQNAPGVFANGSIIVFNIEYEVA